MLELQLHALEMDDMLRYIPEIENRGRRGTSRDASNTLSGAVTGFRRTTISTVSDDLRVSDSDTLVLHKRSMYYETEGIYSPLRHAKTCFRFPLDGRALTTYLHIETNRLRISSFVIRLSLNDLPSSKFPASS